MVSEEVIAEAPAPAPVDKEARDYEMVVIGVSAVEGDSLEAMVNKVSQMITEREGVVGEVARWGKRKLAYPIKHLLEGNYALFQFRLRPEKTKEIEANLRISEDILRYLIIVKG